MPSFMSKIAISRNSSNPYLNPHHPGHKYIPRPPQTTQQRTTLPATTETTDPQQQTQTQTQSQHQHQQTTPSPSIPPSPPPLPSHPSATDLHAILASERTAYQTGAAARGAKTMGTKYDLFAAEMVRRRDDEMRIRLARGGVEYYAPERVVREFYGGGSE